MLNTRNKIMVLPLAVAALAASSSLAFVAGRTFMRPKTVVTVTGPEAHRSFRRSVIQSDLRQVPGEYALIVGDSHVELLMLPTLCGLPTINAGMAGATTEHLRSALATIDIPRRPKVAVLTVGTNDARSVDASSLTERGARFRKSSLALIRRLSKLTDHLIVTAIPPVPDRTPGFTTDVIDTYSGILKDLCGKGLCTFADPFRPADALVYADEIHLANYAQSYRKLDPALCAF
jgi:hypothetical protein